MPSCWLHCALSSATLCSPAGYTVLSRLLHCALQSVTLWESFVCLGAIGFLFGYEGLTPTLEFQNFHGNRLLGCALRLWRDHESCCCGKSLTRFMMSQFAIEFAACRVTQSKLSHPSLRLVPPQQTRNASLRSATRKRSLRELHEKPMHDNRSKQTVLNFYSLSP